MDSSKIPKRTMIKLLLSLSVLSLLPLLLQSSKPFLMNLFIFHSSVDKSYMFLLCNGLLVIITMHSRLTLIDPPSKLTHKLVPSSAPLPVIAATQNVVPVEENSLLMTEQENVVSDDANALVIIYEHENENENEEQEKKRSLSLSLMVTEEEQEGVLSVSDTQEEEGTEELNKKCEEFIRKMKAALSQERITMRNH